MDKIRIEKFTVKQRGGESQDIKIIRRIYPPIKHPHPRKEPIDYGITKEQFENILDKASQPIEKNEGKQK